MMLRQGWAFATSPHGESQTIFNPGISGVPEKRATASISGDCAAAAVNITKAQSAVASRRRFMVAICSDHAADQARRRASGPILTFASRFGGLFANVRIVGPLATIGF